MENLGPRHLAILALAAQGRTDKEIAQKIGISFHTVDYHWRHIRRAYGLTSRTAIVAKYLAGLGPTAEGRPSVPLSFALLRSWPAE